MQRNLTYKPNVFTTENVQRLVLPDRFSVAEIVDFLDVNPAVNEYVQVQINGYPVPRDQWKWVRPKLNAQVLVLLIPHGGGGDEEGGGKNPIAIIAAIAIMAFAGWAGGYLYGTTGILGTSGVGAFTVSTAIGIVGALALSAIFPPPSIASGVSSDTSKPQLSFQGASNAYTPYAPTPRVYGRHRFTPPYGAQPYTEQFGEDEYMYLLFDYGYGPLYLVGHRFGNDPVGNFSDVQMRVVRNAQTSADLRLYTKDVKQTAYNIKLERYNPHIFQTEDHTTSVGIDFALPGLATYWDNEYIPAVCNVAVRYRKVGTTNWTGFQTRGYSFSRIATVESETTVGVIGTTLIDTSIRFWKQISPGVYEQEVTENWGLPTAIEGTDGYWVLTAWGWVYIEGIDPVPVDTIQVVLIPNSLRVGDTIYLNADQPYKITAITGNVLTLGQPLQSAFVTFTRTYIRQMSNDGNDPLPADPTTAELTQQVKVDLGGVDYKFDLYYKSQKPFSFSLKFDVSDEGGTYEVMIERLNSPITTDNSVNEIWVRNLRSYSKQDVINFRVPHTVVEMRIRATDQLNGVINNYSAVATSILSVWDGTNWLTRRTRNNAWILYDILTGTMNPRPLPASRIDLDSILKFAAHCDAPASNDDDEPQYRCDFVLSYSTNLQQLMQDVAAAGRAAMTSANGKYGVVVEQLQTVPVQMFTSLNSWGFSSQKAFTDQPEALNVHFVSPEEDWQERVDIVYNDGFGENNTTLFEELTLFGVTRSAQAWRDGRYYMAEAKLRQETFTFNTDIENLVCKKGDLIEVEYDVPKIGGQSDRVQDIILGGIGNVKYLQIADPAVFEVGKSYSALIRHTDGLLVAHALVNPLTDAYYLELASPVAVGVVNTGDLLVWGEVNKVTESYLVKSIQPGPDLSAQIAAVEQAVGIYDADTGNIPPYNPRITDDPKFRAPKAVTNLRSTETIDFINREAFTSVVVEWDAETGISYKYFSVYQLSDANTWRLVGTPTEPKYVFLNDISARELTGFLGVDFTFLIITVGPNGMQLPFRRSSRVTFEIYGDQGLPGVPTDFRLNVLSEYILAEWVAPVPVDDLGSYEIRFRSDWAISWDNSERLLADIPWNALSATLPARVGTYMIKSIDTSGNASKEFARAKTTIPDLRNLNVIQVINDGVSWNGTLANMEPIGDAIQLVEISPGVYAQDGTYAFSTFVDLGDIFTARCASSLIFEVRTSADKVGGVENLCIYSSALENLVPINSVVSTGPLGVTGYEDFYRVITALGTAGPRVVTTLSVPTTATTYISSIYVADGGTGFCGLSHYDGLDTNGVIFNLLTQTVHTLIGDVLDSGIVVDATGIRVFMVLSVPSASLENTFQVHVSDGTSPFAAAVDEFGYAWGWQIRKDSALAPLVVTDGAIGKSTTLSTIPRELWDVWIEGQVGDLTVTMADWVTLDAVTTMAAGVSDAQNWRRFTVTDFTGYMFWFRVHVRTHRSDINVTVSTAVVNVDMLDRIDSDQNVTAGSGGLGVSFSPAFKVTPDLAITQDDVSQGDRYTITNRTRSGFTIRFWDSGDTAVSRDFDWMARGYGYEATEVI